MTETALVIVGLIALFGFIFGVSANTRLDRALKAKPVTPPPAPTPSKPPATPECEPFTLADVVTKMEWLAEFHAQRQREVVVLEGAGARARWDTSANELAKDAAIYRYLAHRMRQEMESEAAI